MYYQNSSVHTTSKNPKKQENIRLLRCPAVHSQVMFHWRVSDITSLLTVYRSRKRRFAYETVCSMEQTLHLITLITPWAMTHQPTIEPVIKELACTMKLLK